MKNILVLCLVLACLLLQSCNKVMIAEDISQNEANQIIATLARHGIFASSTREDSGKPKYSVAVDNSYYIEAKSILVEKSLPKLDKTSFLDIVESRGLLPNSREIEALRVDHAMAVELEEVLNSHADIRIAKAVVRSHVSDGLSERAVSVIIQEKAEKKINPEEIQNIINTAVPGSKPENIVLNITQESVFNSNEQDSKISEKGILRKDGKEIYVPLTHFLFNWKVPESDYNEIVIIMIICIFVIAIIGGLVGYWYGFFKNSKFLIENGLTDLSARTLRIDRNDRNNSTEI